MVQVSRVENVFQIMYLMRVWCLSPLSRVIKKQHCDLWKLVVLLGYCWVLPGCRDAAGVLPGCCRGAAGVLPGAAGCCRVLPGNCRVLVSWCRARVGRADCDVFRVSSPLLAALWAP